MADTRDRRAIETVACPQCKAWAGKPCFWQGKPTWSLPGADGRLFVHPERRAAWVEHKRLHPPFGGVNAKA